MKRKVEERKPNNNGKGREKTEAFLDGLEVGKEGGGEICKTFAIPRRLGLPPPLFDRGEIEIKDEYYSRRRRLHRSSLSLPEGWLMELSHLLLLLLSAVLGDAAGLFIHGNS